MLKFLIDVSIFFQNVCSSIATETVLIVFPNQFWCSILIIHIYLFTLLSHDVSVFQVDLSEPILSRFDILCVIRDTVEPMEV